MTKNNTFLTSLTNRGPLRIKFATDRKGRPIAYRWARMAARWIRIGVDDAKLMIATGQAVAVHSSFDRQERDVLMAVPE